jgi:hypothetical protein
LAQSAAAAAQIGLEQTMKMIGTDRMCDLSEK